jgi:hypothetical protein
MRVEKGVSTPAADLEALALKLPQRTGRWRVDEGELLRFPMDGRIEARLMDGERARAAAHVHEKLPALLRELPAEDRLLLQLPSDRSPNGVGVARAALESSQRLLGERAVARTRRGGLRRRLRRSVRVQLGPRRRSDQPTRSAAHQLVSTCEDSTPKVYPRSRSAPDEAVPSPPAASAGIRAGGAPHPPRSLDRRGSPQDDIGSSAA